MPRRKNEYEKTSYLKNASHGRGLNILRFIKRIQMVFALIVIAWLNIGKNSHDGTCFNVAA